MVYEVDALVREQEKMEAWNEAFDATEDGDLTASAFGCGVDQAGVIRFSAESDVICLAQDFRSDLVGDDPISDLSHSIGTVVGYRASNNLINSRDLASSHMRLTAGSA